MSIEQIFAKERNRYVQFLVGSRAKIAEEYSQTVGELLLSINNEAIPYPYRYLRVDVMQTLPDGSPKPCEIRIDLDPQFEAQGFNFGAFSVEVYPFTWNSIQVFFNRPIQNIKQLEGWITRWLDVEDKNPTNPQSISQAVHSFTPVEHYGDWWFLTGDFGSAPADALVEFIELMVGQGMTKIVIKGGGAHA